MKYFWRGLQQGDRAIVSIEYPDGKGFTDLVVVRDIQCNRARGEFELDLAVMVEGNGTSESSINQVKQETEGRGAEYSQIAVIEDMIALFSKRIHEKQEHVNKVMREEFYRQQQEFRRDLHNMNENIKTCLTMFSDLKSEQELINRKIATLSKRTTRKK